MDRLQGKWQVIREKIKNIQYRISLLDNAKSLKFLYNITIKDTK